VVIKLTGVLEQWDCRKVEGARPEGYLWARLLAVQPHFEQLWFGVQLQLVAWFGSLDPL
jgi:hypothetical protein